MSVLLGSSAVLRRGGTRIQRWRVPLGFVCAALFILMARPGRLSLAVGGAISILGLAIRAWASGHIRKNDALATSGPYAYTRNPLYLGSFLLGLGFTIGSGWWPLGIVFAALFLGIYFPVMRVESATLAEIFGTAFQRYASEVPLFFPRFTRFRNEAGPVYEVRYRPLHALPRVSRNTRTVGRLGNIGVQGLLLKMNRSRNLLAAILCLATIGAGFANAQKPVHTNSDRPFEPAEELVYEAEFSRALLRKVDVADFRFTAGRTPLNQTVSNSTSAMPEKIAAYSLVFKGDVSSKGFFAKLFNLRFRERMESIVDPISFGVQNTKRVDEQGKRIRNSEAVFDHVAGKVVWTETEPGIRRDLHGLPARRLPARSRTFSRPFTT